MRLANRVAIVTGAGSGIGRAIALRLARLALERDHARGASEDDQRLQPQDRAQAHAEHLVKIIARPQRDVIAATNHRSTWKKGSEFRVQ